MGLLVAIAALTLLVGSPVGALSGLSGPAKAAAPAQAPVVLLYGMLQEIDTLNPMASLEDSGYVAYSKVYDTLVRTGPAFETTPSLADSWDFLDGDTRWRLHLNTTAKWHDGQDFDAYDVEYSINLNLGVSVWTFDPLLDKIASVSVIDSDTIDIHLKFPSRVVIDLIFPILPEHLWSGLSGNAIQYTYPNSNPIGTGPFRNVSWSRGQAWVADRNPDYFLGAPKIDRLVIVTYADPNAMALDLRSGALDIALLDGQNFDALAGVPNIERLATPSTIYLDVGWALNAAPAGKGEAGIKDVNVRQALRIATDLEYINQSIYRGHMDPGSTVNSRWVPFWNYQPNQTEWYFYRWLDISRAPTWAERLQLANQTLDTAGWAWNAGEGAGDPRHKQFGGKTEYLDYVMLVRNGFPDEEIAARLMQAWWAKIGFIFSILIVDEATMENDVYSANEDLYIWYWGGYIDPTFMLGVQTCAQAGLWGDNFWCGAVKTQDSPGYYDRYTPGTQAYDDTFDKVYDDLYALQQTLSADVPRRKIVVDEMSRLHYFDQAFNIYAYLYDLFVWRTDRFTGWGINTMGRNPHNYFNNDMWREVEAISGPVNSAPVLTALAPYTVHVNDTIAYQATATDADGDTLAYSWSFGDGSALQAGNPLTHKYTAEGNYTLQVWVDDGQGHNVTSTTWVNVVPAGVNLPPSNVAITGPATATVGTAASYSASAVDADNDPLTYYWTFGGAGTATGASVSHTWTAEGTYTVTVFVNDGQGHNVSATKAVTVTAEEGEGGVGTLAIVGAAAAAIVVVAAVAYILLRKRRAAKGGPPEGGAPLPP